MIGAQQQSLLNELGHKQTTLSTLWCDNLSATFLTANPVYHARTKHIELDFHFVRKKLANKQLAVHFLCSSDQIANVLTKSLPKSHFLHLCGKFTMFK
jgi:hypothetical protein